MRRIILKIIVASLFFLGLLPVLIAWRESYALQAVLFLLSVAGYAILEVLLGSDQKAQRLRQLSNTLFLATLFLALAVLAKRYLGAQWSGELQIGFLMLSATYYSVTLMQLVFLRGRAARD